MRRGRPIKPVISIESITLALKTLDYTSSSLSETQILESLQLVDFHLQKANRPSAEDIRSWMIRKILVEYITTEVNKIRYYFGLNDVSTRHNRQDELKALDLISQQDSPELAGWSILYVRYVRPELNFSVQELAESLNITQRTLRRYQEIATYKLRDILIDAEWHIRQYQQLNYLKSLIPHHIPSLVGREAECKTVLSYLNQASKFPIHIYGEKGIGKSAFCATIAHTLIEEQSLDYLIWLRNPPSINYIINKLWDTLLPYSSDIHWREILSYQHLLLVLEDIDELAIDTQAWANLSADLQGASVILTSKNPQESAVTQYHMPLSPLNPQNSYLLANNFNTHNLSDVKIDEIIKEAFGNPQQIIQSAQGMSNINPIEYYDELFNGLSESEQIITLLATLSNTGLEVSILEIFIAYPIQESLLYKQNILVNQGQTVYLSDRYISYVKKHLEFDKSLEDKTLYLANMLLENMDNLLVSAILLDCFTCEWYSWDKAIVLQVLDAIELETISHNDVFRWRNLYLSYMGLDEDNPSTSLHYKHGIALRLLHHPDCEPYLIKLVHILGSKGYFQRQVKALYQLALLYQFKAEFKKATNIYNQVLGTFSQYATEDLLKNIDLQLARLAISRKDADSALEKLRNSDLADIEVFILFCEAKFIQAEYAFIIDTALKYINQSEISSKYSVLLRTILARSYQETGAYDNAIVHFNEALSIIEQDMSQANIGRARTNLASAYLNSIDRQNKQTLHDIEKLLIETQELQSQVSDNIGLEATTRNLDYLRTYRLKNI
ncbi:MAG: hypothetical protein Phog2KO_16430 [Phototrophicaceae bacterium]